MSKVSAAAKFEFFELGDKTSLICTTDDISETVRNILRDLNFKSHTVDNADEAVDRLRYTQYNCIVVSEQFCGSTLITNVSMVEPEPNAPLIDREKYAEANANPLLVNGAKTSDDQSSGRDNGG